VALRDGHKELSAIAIPQFTGLSPVLKDRSTISAWSSRLGVSLPTIYVNSSRLCLGKSNLKGLAIVRLK